MNKVVTKLTPEVEISDPLALLRAPFPANQISKLPKPTAKREVMDGLPKAKCAECGGYHATSRVIHLDYVGHAAVTDRLLDADPMWSWEPCAFGPDGLPAFDPSGGLWIKLTVGGVTRLGYGHAGVRPGMDPGAREKEVIGDALRNAGMRFGMALDLWHKGDLHAHDAEDEAPPPSAEDMAVNLLRGCGTKEMFADAWGKNKDGWKKVLGNEAYARLVGEMRRLAANFPKDAPPAEVKQQVSERQGGEISRAASQPATAEAPILDDEIPF